AAVNQTGIQLVQLNNKDGTGTVIARLDPNPDPMSPPTGLSVNDVLGQQDPMTMAFPIVAHATSVTAIPAAAFNPIDGQLYFVGRGSTITRDAMTGGGNTLDTVDALYSLDPYAADVAGSINGAFGPPQALNTPANLGTFGDAIVQNGTDNISVT